MDNMHTAECPLVRPTQKAADHLAPDSVLYVGFTHTAMLVSEPEILATTSCHTISPLSAHTLMRKRLLQNQSSMVQPAAQSKLLQREV